MGNANKVFPVKNTQPQNNFLLADNLKSQLNLSKQRYEAMDFEPGETERLALRDFGKQALTDALSGMISGVALGGIKTGYNKWNPKVGHQDNVGAVDITADYEAGLFRYYSKLLKENAPSTLEEFSKIRYDNGEKWQQLKKDFAVVERYEARGDVPVDQIIELDEIAYHNKTEAFDYSKLHGDDKEKIKKLCKGGNAAVMTLDGKVYFSHSSVETEGTLEYDSYAGEQPLVGLSNKRNFEVLDLGDGILRQYDTEAKFLEYVASTKTDRTEAFVVTILSEKHICKSCEFVVEQFKKLFPNATVNIVSGNPNYGKVNGKDEHGMNNWKHRKD